MIAGPNLTLNRRGTGPAGPGPTALRTGPRPTAVRRGLVVSAVIGVLVLLFLLLAVFTAGTSGGQPFDVGSTRPQGTRALAEILRGRGVTVTPAETVPTGNRPVGSPGTVIVFEPGRLDRDALTGLLGQVWQGSDVVLVGAGDAVLDVLEVGVRTSDDSLGSAAAPRCALPEAAVAGTVPFEGSPAYTRGRSDPGGAGGVGRDRADMQVVLCYGDPPTAAQLVVLTPAVSTTSGGTAQGGTAAGGGRLVLVSSADFLTNSRLDHDGGAALALGLLGRHTTLTWLIPAAASRDAVDARGPFELLPSGVRWGVLQVAVVLLLLGLWRGRRLGPPVPEPLAVVVRAAESVEGHGRLYASARARDQSADVLRAALRVRLAERIGLPLRAGPAGTPEPDPVALVASVAEQSGRSPSDIGSLLYGSGMVAPIDARPGPFGRAMDQIRSRGLPPEPPVWPRPGTAVALDPAGPAAAPRGGDREPGRADRALLALAHALDDLDRQVGGR
ncbi:DUF4350 domain-containing protein [Frankia sp. R82]|uniref:DUF4350 domain-containing protein n=1 Tax=Frankia sp. R82 TaxID=2950553 RepID=UPI002044AA48|nr:DUF4350 domain-containing protein [Frankia sp. R82]MCM3887639.1 DUF4350 domain-containing protein [Frankia sp. R82]